ncbi:MAG: sigma-70 family RNA polymerase sigma factor [Clostridiales bacterium]|nr:sigma-70 family RNA polymerase sigma factor [Clostridiales bacterium]
MDDKGIIELFFARSEEAIAMLSSKYGGMLFKLAMNVLDDRRDAEECVNDAYLGVWNAIPPARPDPLSAFVSRIVRNISVDRFRRNSAAKRKSNYAACLEELENGLCSGKDPGEEMDEAALSGLIDEFLDKQNEGNAALFVRRFWHMESYGELARRSGVKEGAIRTRISRMKAELRAFLTERGVEM